MTLFWQIPRVGLLERIMSGQLVEPVSGWSSNQETVFSS
ncbi:baseplate wedge subunit [Salmonella phage 19]|nr:baseplate wedge subunit [Salmonella phage 19]